MSADASLRSLLDAIDALVDRADMPRRAALCADALAVVDRGTNPLVWGILQRELGTSLVRGPGGDEDAAAKEAIAAYRRALEVLTVEAAPMARAATLVNLANACAERVNGDRGRAEEEVIALYEDALALFGDAPEAAPAGWASTQNLLGTALSERLEGDTASNLERAIHAYEQALEVRTREARPDEWAATTANLAGALLERLEGVREDNVDRAIALYEQALTVLTEDRDPGRWARAQHNLVTAYRLRGDPGDYHLAHAAGGRALTVRTRCRRPREWAATTVALAELHAWRGTLDDLRRAIARYRQAHEVLSEDTDPEEWARVAFNLALALAESGARADAARHVRMAMRVYQAEDHPDQHRQALGTLGDLAFADRDWRDADAAYQAALRTGADSFARAETEGGRRAKVKQTWHLHARAGYSLLRLGRIPDALLTLERGKGRLLRAALGSEPEGDPPIERMLGLVPAGGALVAPVVTPQGGAALVVPSGRRAPGPHDVVWLDDLTDVAVVELIGGAPDAPLSAWLGALMSGRGAAAGSVAQLAWADQIADATERLWDLLMGPVHDRLQRLGMRRGAPVVVLPQGGLSLLPLAAARRTVGDTTFAFLDAFTVVVAPSAFALTVGRRTTAAGRAAPSLFATADPVGDLPHARVEGHLVANAFDAPARCLLPGSEATKRAVMSSMRRSTHLHFATHGRHSWDRTQSSALDLAAGAELTLGEIRSELRLDAARLVVLSACETGLTELGRVVDEYVGLPTGFLAAGAPAVVSTLWTVDDATTALLMSELYRRHLACGEDSAAALAGAQRWLRDLDRDETLAALEPARAVARALMQQGDPADIRMWAAVENFREEVLETWGPRDRPWSSPYFWGGFVHVGAGQR